jgi:glucose-6-phosphate isomerase
VILQYVGVCHLLETKRQVILRVLSVWAKALESFGLWYDQLLAESLGKQERGATPLTTVNTRDLHSRHQQHEEGRRDKLFTNVILESWRCDALPVGHSDMDQDKLNEFRDNTLPDLMAAAIAGTNEALREAGRPTADIRLHQLRESTLGQLLQMMMIATVVEGRLIGVNPYGQPGVEGYKRNMMKRLRK